MNTKLSYHTFGKPKGPPQQKPQALSEQFLQRAREKRAKGEECAHWFKAAEIIRRIENDKPVGHYRRRRNKREGRPA